MVKHFIDTQDFSKTEIENVLELIKLIKEADKDGCPPQLFKNKTLAMIFEEPSTRTRISFEVAAAKMGGHALYLKPGEIHLGERESLHDTAKVVSSMCDCIMARTWVHKTVTDIAKWSSVPVINGLTDLNHPTQALCDVFTMMEHLPKGKQLSDCKVVFISDRTNVCSSTMWICAQLGMDFTHVAPKAYQSPQEWVDQANAHNTGAKIVVTDKIDESIKDADFIYTDLWWWVDQEDEAEERKAAFMPDFQITPELLNKAPDHCKLMHCLPASRNVEATDAALDGEKSIIFYQAENRLHAEKGILAWVCSPEFKQPTKELADYHEGKVQSFIARCGWDR